MGLPVEWSDFYVVNALVIVLGVVAATSQRAVGVAPAFPALMLFNATFFHMSPAIRAKGRFSPSLFSAIVLFCPIGILAYCRAVGDATLTAQAVIVSIVIGALLMATPVVLLLVKYRPYFRRDR